MHAQSSDPTGVQQQERKAAEQESRLSDCGGGEQHHSFRPCQRLHAAGAFSAGSMPVSEVQGAARVVAAAGRERRLLGRKQLVQDWVCRLMAVLRSLCIARGGGACTACAVFSSQVL